MPDNIELPEFLRLRKDGWPLCPRCGEDELYSVLMLRWNGAGPKPSIDDCMLHPFCCYQCNWSDGLY